MPSVSWTTENRPPMRPTPFAVAALLAGIAALNVISVVLTLIAA
jgi:hypothetical protein